MKGIYWTLELLCAQHGGDICVGIHLTEFVAKSCHLRLVSEDVKAEMVFFLGRRGEGGIRHEYNS